MSNEHFDAELVATEYANQYPEKDYHDLQHAVIYGVIAYSKHIEGTHALASSNLVELEKAIKKLDEAVIIDSNCGVEYQTGYNDGLTEAINILKNLTIKE